MKRKNWEPGGGKQELRGRDEWIPIRPGTDHTLALALAYTLLDEDDPKTNPLIDWDFLHGCTVGFDADHMPAGADPRPPGPKHIDWQIFREYYSRPTGGMPMAIC